MKECDCVCYPVCSVERDSIECRHTLAMIKQGAVMIENACTKKSAFDGTATAQPKYKVSLFQGHDREMIMDAKFVAMHTDTTWKIIDRHDQEIIISTAVPFMIVRLK